MEPGEAKTVIWGVLDRLQVLYLKYKTYNCFHSFGVITALSMFFLTMAFFHVYSS